MWKGLSARGLGRGLPSCRTATSRRWRTPGVARCCCPLPARARQTCSRPWTVWSSPAVRTLTPACTGRAGTIRRTHPGRTGTRGKWRSARARWNETCPCLPSAAACNCSTSASGAPSISTSPRSWATNPTGPRWAKRAPTGSSSSRAAPSPLFSGHEAEGLCHHHQGVDRLGGRLRAVGFADDGSVEAVEVLGSGFAVGVQWHPEDDPADRRLFVALVEAALGHAGGRPARPSAQLA